MTGSMPGRAASMADTCVFGSAPNAVAAPENNFDLAMICAWVSRPMTTSHFPVRPSINVVTGLLPSLPIYTGVPAKAGTHPSAVRASEKWVPAFAGTPDESRDGAHFASASSPRVGDEAGAVSKLRGAFENIADPQHHLLIEGAADDLQAGRQHIGADQDAPLHLRSEPFGAGQFIHLVEAVARNAQPVFDAVITREVRRGFGRRDDVIRRQRVFGHRQRHLDRLGAGFPQPLRALLPQCLDLGRHAVRAILFR